MCGFVPSLPSFVLAQLLGLGLSACSRSGLARAAIAWGCPCRCCRLMRQCSWCCWRCVSGPQSAKVGRFAAGTPEKPGLLSHSNGALSSAASRCALLPLRLGLDLHAGRRWSADASGAVALCLRLRVLGPDGQRVHCRDEATILTEYRAYRLPVLATAAGTVVAIESSQPDNPIGTVNVEHNWGNYVVLQHGPALFRWWPTWCRAR